MNILLVIKVISILLLIIAGFMIFPVLFAVYYGELHLIRVFLIPIIASLLFFIIIRIFIRNKSGKSLSTKDGFLLVASSWISASLIGCLPFFLSGAVPTLADAFFETMSGFTTTGATIFTEIEALPKALLFWRSLTHWLGGMGIVVLTVAIFPLLGIGGLQLIKAEAPGPTVDKITPKITETAKILWMIYITLTIVETVLLLAGGLNLFDSLTHTFGTMATGGFSPKNTSVGFYNSSFVDWVITIFMLMAGINFILYFKLITGQLKSIRRNSEFKAYLGIFAAATLIVTINLYGKSYATFADSLRYAGFQVSSILTTTGFATADYEKWPMLSQVILFVVMFIGGCSGSTGGGIKVIRIITLFKQGINEMKLLIRPRGIFSIRIDGKVVRKQLVYAVSGFVLLYIFLLLLTTTVVASGEYDIVTSLSTALATLGNIGPGFGLVGPSENYSFFQPYIKWFLSFAMMAGRLEIYTVLVLILPAFWRR
ncbi:MAG: TrkH family potassium uptake protein [Spirochaetia bacterium]|jgi:trk system potassium uptake protein TrkH|nr:TrkH family potassium uptake protein [Spirochaetia bacterium]